MAGIEFISAGSLSTNSDGDPSMKEKMIKDPIHNYIDLHPAAVAIIDTPQFQRLRDLGQLGGVYYVFAGATGKRFEHSLGVAHLARTFVKQLRRNQPDLGITDVEELCVHLSGLVHDLGHGPFSHLFDGKFVKATRDPKLPPWVHEHASIAMLDHLIQANNLSPVLSKHGIGDKEIHFIKELVLGSSEDAPQGFEWKGQPPNKAFLYDIVANHRNGIDVDKFDYFARDCYTLGIQKTFDADRLMKCARVCKVPLTTFDTQKEEEGGNKSESESVLRICFEKKEVWNVYELFHTRFSLHKRAYQHRVSTVVEHMFSEVLMAANPHVVIAGDKDQSGVAKQYKMSTCVDDMSAYQKMSDWIIYHIQHSNSEELETARQLLHRIRSRQLYKFVGEVIDQPDVDHNLMLPNNKGVEGGDVVGDSGISGENGTLTVKKKNKKARELEVMKQIVYHCNEVSKLQKGSLVITMEDVLVCVVEIGYGKGEENPVNFTHFYTTDRRRDSSSPSMGSPGQLQVGIIPSEKVSTMVPAAFSERWCRVWCRDNQKLTLLKQGFDRWIEQDMGQNSSSFGVPSTAHSSASASPASSTKSSTGHQLNKDENINPALAKKLKL